MLRTPLLRGIVSVRPSRASFPGQFRSNSTEAKKVAELKKNAAKGGSTASTVGADAKRAGKPKSTEIPGLSDQGGHAVPEGDFVEQHENPKYVGGKPEESSDDSVNDSVGKSFWQDDKSDGAGKENTQKKKN